MMAVRYHGCTCHQRHPTLNGSGPSSNGTLATGSHNGHGGGNNTNGGAGGREVVSSAASKELQVAADEAAAKDKDQGDNGEIRPQPWYFHVVASLILVVHGFTFLVPQDPESEDTDMVRTVAKWFGYEMEWIKQFTPYAQVNKN